MQPVNVQPAKQHKVNVAAVGQSKEASCEEVGQSKETRRSHTSCKKISEATKGMYMCSSISSVLIFKTTGGRRQLTCGQCTGCLAPDCGQCINCRDKKKFGGLGKRKQRCKEKQCLAIVAKE